tara:strand:- start:6064 stop:6378 length:315 start_codon:yes stop_codon:yes gene_type:complete
MNSTKLDIALVVSSILLIAVLFRVASVYDSNVESPKTEHITSHRILTMNFDGLIHTGFFSEEDIAVLNNAEGYNSLNKLAMPVVPNYFSLNSTVPLLYPNDKIQ